MQRPMFSSIMSLSKVGLVTYVAYSPAGDVGEPQPGGARDVREPSHQDRIVLLLDAQELDQ